MTILSFESHMHFIGEKNYAYFLYVNTIREFLKVQFSLAFVFLESGSNKLVYHFLFGAQKDYTN